MSNPENEQVGSWRAWSSFPWPPEGSAGTSAPTAVSTWGCLASDASTCTSDASPTLLASYGRVFAYNVARYRVTVTAHDGAGNGAVFDLEGACVDVGNGPAWIGAPRSAAAFASEGTESWSAELGLSDGQLVVWVTGAAERQILWLSRIAVDDSHGWGR